MVSLLNQFESCIFDSELDADYASIRGRRSGKCIGKATYIYLVCYSAKTSGKCLVDPYLVCRGPILLHEQVQAEHAQEEVLFPLKHYEPQRWIVWADRIHAKGSPLIPRQENHSM